MKRFFASFFARAWLVAGFLSVAVGVARAASTPVDFTGSYAANLSSLETPAGSEIPVEVLYGRLELKVSAKGSVINATGTLKNKAGKSYPVSTKLVPSGVDLIASDAQSQNNVGAAKIKGTSSYLINFRLTLKADGSVVVGGLDLSLGAESVQFDSAGSYKFAKFTGKPDDRPSWIGNYTLAFLTPEGAPEAVPAGAGYASLSVNSVGKLNYKGKLGDGTSFTGSADPISGAVYSIYAVPPGYATGGYLLSELDLDRRGEQAEPTLWNKPEKTTDKAYPGGFSTGLIAVVQPWLVPAKKAYPIATSLELGFGYSKNFSVDFSGEGLFESDFSTSLPDVVRITGLAKIQAVAGGDGAPAENNSKDWDKLWKVSLNPLTGVFAGKQTIKRTIEGKTTTTVADVEGVFSFAETLGEAPFAYGQYRLNNVSGLVTFSGPLEDNKAVAASGSYTVKIFEEDATDVITKVSGAQTFISPPKRPAGSPTTGQVVKFSLSEDLQTLTFNGQVLKFKESVGLGGRLYHKAVIAPGIGKASGQFAVTIRTNATTGAVEDVFGFAQFLTPLNLSGDSRAQNTVFKAQPPASTAIIKLP